MANADKADFSRLSFFNTFFMPALWVFLIPSLTLAFFLHAQHRFDSRIREDMLAQVRSSQLNDQEKAEQIAVIERVPMSRMILEPEIATGLPADLDFYYAWFRNMIRLSFWSIVSGVLVFLVGGVCVIASFRSQFIQYYSLSLGWQLLRVFSALQTVAQGVMLVALSFWVTALWFEFYAMKLIFIAGAVALMAVLAVLKGIFTFPKMDFSIEGKLLDPSKSAALWSRLKEICDKVGTQPPDQIIAGIDDNFYVTEQPVVVEGKKLKGRTLFISLALLKQLDSSEADAILAHEMAHFSGKDTLYSKRIAPLLMRYDHYLHALSLGALTLPVFYFMRCFRALYQWSLGALSRQREFRADKIAAETTSAHALAAGLLRTVAYSQYRVQVQDELFKQERALKTANVAERVEQGFPSFAVGFASQPELAQSATAHPFDSHPPLDKRLEAVNVEAPNLLAPLVLAQRGDAGWYSSIEDAETLERSQWNTYEEMFRLFHSQSLAYRFLPTGEEETALVEEAFPELTFESKDGTAIINYLQMQFPSSPQPILFSEVQQCTMNDDVLSIALVRDHQFSTVKVKTKRYSEPAALLDAIGRYLGRYQAAFEYQKHKASV